MITLSLILITKERRKISQLHNKFILERYLNNFNFKRSSLVHDENEFYKNRRHLINKNGSYYLENEYLEKKYQKITKKRWLLKNGYAIINLSLVKKTNMGH